MLNYAKPRLLFEASRIPKPSQATPGHSRKECVSLVKPSRKEPSDVLSRACSKVILMTSTLNARFPSIYAF